MLQSRSILTELAEAVADGRVLDWGALDLSPLDEPDRARVAELRAICSIGRRLSTLTSGSTLLSASVSSASLGADEIQRVVPAVWGALRIRELVGRGRFGDVYRAWDPAIDREVALKLLRQRHSRPPESDSEVVHEGRLMARVRHPNVATIYGAAHFDGRTGLWMEFVEGRTLEAELRDRGRFDPAEIAQIGIELCRALAAVHDAGLVHRDVKAQNVMREVNGRVVLGDFGTGLELDEAEVSGVGLAGTPLYLGPEVFRGAAPTPQSDLYSLGVVLFHLATEWYPVRGRTIDELRDAHARGEVTHLLELRPDFPVAFAHVIERVLEADPENRFVSARETERALAEILAPPLIVAERAAVDSPPQSRNAQRRWRLSAPMMILAAVSAGAAVWLAVSPSRNANLASAGLASAGLSARPVGLETRNLSRVPAPMDINFWGRPSRDGRLYTFIDFNSDVCVFDTATGERRRLTNSQETGGHAYMSAVFSKDGSRIAYSWQLPDGPWELRVMPASGGTPRTVLRHPEDVVHALEWSHDGEQILSVIERPGGSRTLALVSSIDGSLRRIAPLDALHWTATLSPDDRFVVFDKGQGPESLERDIFIASLDAPGEPTPLVTGSADDFGPLWAPDGTRIVFASDRSREPSIWALPILNGLPNGDPSILHRNVGRAEPTGLSADGTLFYHLVVGFVDVSMATMDFESGRVVDGPRPVAEGELGSSMNSSFSRDGRHLAYVAIPHGGLAGRTRRLAILEIEGGTRMLAPALGGFGSIRWARDGSMLLVKGSDLQSKYGLFLVDPLSGDLKRVATAATDTDIGAVQWGSDDRTILFTREKVGLVRMDVHTGAEQTVMTFASEGINAIAPNGFRFSPDGRSLIYVGYRTRAGRNEVVLRAKIDGAPTRDLEVGPFFLGAWLPDGQHVLVTKPTGSERRAALWSIPVHGGPARALGLEAQQLRDVSLHPDGRRITFTSGTPGQEIWRLDRFLPVPQ